MVPPRDFLFYFIDQCILICLCFCQHKNEIMTDLSIHPSRFGNWLMRNLRSQCLNKIRMLLGRMRMGVIKGDGMVEEKHQVMGLYSEALTTPKAWRSKDRRERTMKHRPPGRSCGLPEGEASRSLQSCWEEHGNKYLNLTLFSFCSLFYWQNLHSSQRVWEAMTCACVSLLGHRAAL